MEAHSHTHTHTHTHKHTHTDSDKYSIVAFCKNATITMSSFNYKGSLTMIMNRCEAFGSINNTG